MTPTPNGGASTVTEPETKSLSGRSIGAVKHARMTRGLMPGLFAACVIGAVALLLGSAVPVVGAPVFAITLGMLCAPMIPSAARITLRPGLGFGGKYVLQVAIVVLGLELSLRQVARVGLGSLPVMLGTLALALLAAALFGRLLRIRRDLSVLIGVGTGICGASAIAATTAVIDADETDTAYAITTIFAFNVVAVLLYPTVGTALGLSQHAFGLWAGTAINDTSSVAAAATIYGMSAATYAIVVKLTRTLMIIPICVALAGWRARSAPHPVKGVSRLSLSRMFPKFILFFLAAAAFNSTGILPRGWHGHLATAATVLITLALASIGLSARFREMRSSGFKPLLLGGLLWATVGISSLLLQAASGRL